MRHSTLGISLAAAVCTPLSALAQEDFSVNWHTIDCGGGSSNGEEFLVVATIAQPDAGILQGPETGESFVIVGGFWSDGATCYSNCDSSTAAPLLTPNDFACFLNAYVNGQSYANCDGSTASPILTSNDFVCFINMYAIGCS